MSLPLADLMTMLAGRGTQGFNYDGHAYALNGQGGYDTMAPPGGGGGGAMPLPPVTPQAQQPVIPTTVPSAPLPPAQPPQLPQINPTMQGTAPQLNTTPQMGMTPQIDTQALYNAFAPIIQRLLARAQQAPPMAAGLFQQAQVQGAEMQGR